MQVIGPIIAASATVGGMIFQMGKQSEKLDFIGMKVEAQEKKEEFLNEKLCEIYNKMNTLQNDVSYMKEDVHDIKLSISK
tara:strand:- start:98 stop:337 length:240 start_codon:yes stop_codon:yes gene_type:complete